MSVIRDPLPDMPAQCLWRKQFTAFVIVEGDFYDMVILYTLSPEIPVKQYVQEIWLPAPTNPGYCFHQPVLLSVLQPLQVNIPSDSLLSPPLKNARFSFSPAPSISVKAANVNSLITKN